MKPFLKWAGNKYHIIERLNDVIPLGERLIEPFVGSGAVFLNTHFSEYLLADTNPDLIQLYNFLQNEGETFIDDCEAFFKLRYNTPNAYYQLREEFNLTHDKRLKAEIFLYLNRHGYNGLCRYNNKGKFNVPFGRYKKPYFPAKEMLNFYKLAQHAKFIRQDFMAALSQAKYGDVIYCDPPYVPLTSTANFTNYFSEGFNETKQVMLAKLAEHLRKQGITVIISNHDTEFTRNLYARAKVIEFDVQRNISCNGKTRVRAKELIAVYVP